MYLYLYEGYAGSAYNASGYKSENDTEFLPETEGSPEEIMPANSVYGTEELLLSALYSYGVEKQIEFPESRIERTENGKPYFANIEGIEFSVTHSGVLWACLFSEGGAVGLDIQEYKGSNAEKIADRYFTPDEKHYVDLWGTEGFMNLWVRKEALVKALGTTLGKGLSRYELASGGDLLEKVTVGGREYVFRDIEISPEIKCACCSEKAEEIYIRTLN